jgi:2-C-methyl-D-erythritol 4-phosphate cytidylyltransferase
MRAAAIIVAAGRGERLRSRLPKALVELGGEPLLSRVLRRFLCSDAVQEICVAGPPSDLDRCRALLPDPGSVSLRVIAGGERRQDSVRLALDTLSQGIDVVAVHDGARPLVPIDLIRRTIEAASREGAAIAAVAVIDSVKEASRDGWITAQPSREGLWLAQTPQSFRREILQEAYLRAERDGFTATDDASLVARLGVPIRIIPGHASNLKITGPEDLRIAEAWLALEERNS